MYSKVDKRLAQCILSVGGPLSDRRNFTRIPSQLEAVWESSGGAVPAKLRNISQSGAFLQADIQATRGDEACLRMFNGVDELSVKARVVRACTDEDGYGIRFIGMDLELRRAIANLLLWRTAAQRSRKS